MMLWLLTLTALSLQPACGQRIESGLAPAAATRQDQPFDHEHALWTRTLAAHVLGSRFDYKALGESRGDLDLYLLSLRGVSAEDFATWTRDERYAFWVNAYNAFTVHLVLTRYPVDSIKDIGGVLTPVWKMEFIPLGHLYGEGVVDQISLDTIEHKILRPQFEDARVHAAVNCASESCPPLAAEAFRAEVLDTQLDARVRVWLADSSLNRFDCERKRLELSAIFDWFASDFERDAGSVRAWLARYAPAEVKACLEGSAKLKIETLTYSWKLNAVPEAER
jgi:hypothetical protein